MLREEDAPKELVRELLVLMERWDIRQLAYTNRDDGIHAFTNSGVDWCLGFPGV